MKLNEITQEPSVINLVTMGLHRLSVNDYEVSEDDIDISTLHDDPVIAAKLKARLDSAKKVQRPIRMNIQLDKNPNATADLIFTADEKEITVKVTPEFLNDASETLHVPIVDNMNTLVRTVDDEIEKCVMLMVKKLEDKYGN